VKEEEKRGKIAVYSWEKQTQKQRLIKVVIELTEIAHYILWKEKVEKSSKKRKAFFSLCLELKTSGKH